MNKPIVSVAGLRGIVDVTFTPEIIVPYVAAFADLLTKRRVVVGGDSRPSREWAQPVVEAALRARGVDVISIGLAPTPTIGMMVNHFKAGGGVAITASHNPIEWNGLKFFNSHGEFLTPAQNELLQRRLKTPAPRKGTLRIGKHAFHNDCLQLHIARLEEVLGAFREKQRRKPRVVLDCCNGAASELAPLVASAFGVAPEIIFANPGRKFPRGAEPVPENIRVLGREVVRCGADFGAAFDPDGDRMALVDEAGRAIGEERTLILAIDSYLTLSGVKTPLVANLSTSHALDFLAEKHETTVGRTKVGEAHVLAGMRRYKSLIGGEGNGGVILPAVHPGRDGATALALILLGLGSKRHTLSRWNQVVPELAILKGKINIGGVSVKSTLRRARALFKDAATTDETDGLKLLYDDGSWVQFRPSGTEPILRVFVEAPDKGTAKELMVRAQAIVR
ncbi:hypothetical protein HZA57_09485 [Candidatus Poribacteria bacterium]|nr:hypothetical protein [Candidatus Poribacteria bacterium]